jgi:hypothetical protein
MPEVGYDNKPKRYDLKTAPPDGYVELRRLPYDEILVRREMATRLSMEQAPQRSRRNARQDRQKPATEAERSKLGIELVQVKTREFEFKSCIVDHNLLVDGVKVDFSRPSIAFKIVPPEILQEIELILSELNLETDEDELEDFTPRALSLSSTEDANKPKNNLEPVS